jgi:type IV secretory pathway VirB3-like protein
VGEGRYAFRIDGKGLRGIRGDSIYFPAVSRKRNISKAIVFGIRAIYMGWTAAIVYDQNFFAIGFEEVQVVFPVSCDFFWGGAVVTLLSI